MAKELPYFKFFVSEWMNGNITLCDYSTQGLFVNVVALYWFSCCKLKKQTVVRRLCAGDATALNPLIDEKIIAVDRYDNIVIKFLDEQLLERQDISEKAKTNAHKGWIDKEKRKASRKEKANAAAMQPHSNGNSTPMLKEEKRTEEKRKEKIHILPALKAGEYVQKGIEDLITTSGPNAKLPPPAFEGEGGATQGAFVLPTDAEKEQAEIWFWEICDQRFGDDTPSSWIDKTIKSILQKTSWRAILKTILNSPEITIEEIENLAS